MRRSDFLCDLCGTVLERHGERYLVHIERVPAYRSAFGNGYDLCPTCAAKVIEAMGERPWLGKGSEDKWNTPTAMP